MAEHPPTSGAHRHATALPFTPCYTQLPSTFAPGAGLACVELVFAYLELLRKSGPQKWAWEEMANVAAMKFR